MFLARLQPWRRPLLWLAALLALVLLALLIRGGLYWRNIHAPLALEDVHILEVVPGTNLRRVLSGLEEQGIVRDSTDLLIYARFTDLATRMQAGEYELQPGLDGRALLALLASGKVLYHQVRLLEGWTLQQALTQIQAHPAVRVELDPQDREALQVAFGTEYYPEGLFFPDTYHFTRGTSDIELLQRARVLMDEVLMSLWPARDSGLPFDTPYEALILASIVEKETGQAAERERLAGVVVRRLQRNMRLQTDPTVIYGVGDEFDGNLTRAHLRADTPWNTYTRHGLPPTPIALPGLDSIAASLHPEPGEALYFVSMGDGSHYFSSTLEEHNQAVRRYQLNRQTE